MSALLPGFAATQHLTGPVLVSGDTARTHVRAHHWLGGEVWTVYGHYVVRLAGDRMDLPYVAAAATARRG